MSENTNPETNVPAEQAAPKRQLRNPFAKKSTTDSGETAKSRKTPHGIYTVGVLLVVAGVVGAVVTKATSPREDKAEESETSTDENAA